MATNDRPATPEEKLWLRLGQAEKSGKAFDEVVERQVLGLPPVAGRDPLVLAESRDRARLTQREDAAAKEELATAAKATEAASLAEENAKLRAKLALLEGREAEVTGTPAPMPPTAEPPAPSASGPLVPDGEPNENWTARQIIAAYQGKGFTPPLPRAGMGMSKRALLDAYLAAKAKAEEGDAA